MTAPSTALLAYIPSPPQGVWNLGPLPLRAYALCIIAGIVVAVWWGNRRWKARGGQDGEVLDVAIWAVPFGLIGGRLYHVITDWQTYFGDGPKEPLDAIRIWDGGLGIWGAVAFGAVGAWIGARRAGIKLPAFGDAIAPPILLAQAIGRLGNYFNQELFGRETDLPWGLKIYERSDGAGRVGYDVIDGVSTGVVDRIVHPTFLYELLWSLLAVVVLVLVDRYTRIGHGRLFALYVALYCVGRFGVELMRSDHATLIAGIRINVFTAAIVFACAAAYFVVAPKGRELGLTMYHPWKAEELEALGHTGYVDTWIDDEWDDGADVAATGGPTPDDALTAAIARHVPPTEPENTSTERDDALTEPEDAPTEPEDASTEPEDASTEPDGTATEPADAGDEVDDKADDADDAKS